MLDRVEPAPCQSMQVFACGIFHVSCVYVCLAHKYTLISNNGAICDKQSIMNVAYFPS